MSDVFVSYAREDQTVVRWLVGELTGQGRDVWVDWEGIPPSAKWRDEVEAAIEGAGAFVFVITPDSLDSPVCREELAHAVGLNKRVVPVLVRNPGDRPLPDAVELHNWVFCRTKREREENLDRIVEALDTDLDWVKAHTRLLVRALEWDAKQENRSLLLRGTDLRDAESALQHHADKRPSPTPLQRRYVLVSRQLATRRLRQLVAGSLVAVVLIASLGVVAVIQAVHAHSTAQVALSRELAASANAQLNSDPQLSLLLALQAYDTQPTVQAESAVRQATLQNRERVV